MLEPSQDEAQALKEAQYFEQLEASPAWTMLKGRMALLVEEAHESIVGAVAPEPNVALSLLTRYQQRLAVTRDIENFVAQQAENKKQILESLQEPSGDDDARDYERT